MNVRRIIIKVLLSVFAITAGGLISYHYIHKHQHAVATKAEIIDFDDARDTASVLDFFVKDRYWLLSSPDYDPAYALKTRSPNKNEEKYTGKMTIKVLRKDNQLVGFISYYMRTFIEGTILFLAVKPEFRGKGYAQLLMNYALKDLKKQGAYLAQLVTRTSNTQAQSVYKKAGFTETERDDQFVHYRKYL